jgi:hypothetical protein
MDSLTDRQVRALRNLAEKRAGNVTAFLNIGDAQRLTLLGLASRSRQGWDITAAGAAYLAGLGGSSVEVASVISLQPGGDGKDSDR